mmetsp:Transcript_52114/g.93405  ORF Transcript_52114/g.93405 Transcript_52114/m.93405 type:complete len:566 (-) Transcript_52114:23-1720(-)
MDNPDEEENAISESASLTSGSESFDGADVSDSDIEDADFVRLRPMEAKAPEVEVTEPIQKLWNYSSRAHLVDRFELKLESGSWVFLPKEEERSLAESTEMSTLCAALKIKAASAFIEAFPKIVEVQPLPPPDEEQIGKEEDLDYKELLEQERVALGNAESPAGSSLPALPKQKLAAASLLSEQARSQRIAAMQARMEKAEDDRLHLPEPNRLDGRLTEDNVREVCRFFYDNENEEARLSRIGSVEAALLAWDLTRDIHGSWRVPFTVVSERAEKRYCYVCIIVILGEHAAALGRSNLQEISFIPLAKQRISRVVDRIATSIRSRGHELISLYLGLPSLSGKRLLPKVDSDDLHAGTEDHPIVWRLLKLGCMRQEWESILASCDFLIARRQEVSNYIASSMDPLQELRQKLAQGITSRNVRVRGVKSGAGKLEAASLKLPAGFASFCNQNGEMRLKVTPPVLVRRRRRKKDPTVCLGGPIRAGGVWQEDAKDLSTLSVKLGNMHNWTTKGSSNMDWRNLRHKHHLAKNDAEARLPNQDEDCSSVSSVSLDEYTEDYRLALLEVRTP